MSDLSEADKDRVAAAVHRARVDAYESGSGAPEERFTEALAALSIEERNYALELLDQRIAHFDELGPDPIIERIDAAKARGEGNVER